MTTSLAFTRWFTEERMSTLCRARLTISSCRRSRMQSARKRQAAVMGTMVTSTNKVAQTKIGLGGGKRPAGPNGGSRGGNGRDGGGDDAFRRFSPSKYRIGMWVALAGVT